MMRDAGFTLIELMLVILLMGLLATVPMLVIGGDSPDARVEKAARQVLAGLVQARESAVLGGRELGFFLEAQRYGFAELVIEENDTDGSDTDNSDELDSTGFQWRWQALGRHDLPREIQVSLQLDGLLPELEGAGDEDDPEQVTPQVFIFSSGELTPFALSFSHPDAERGPISLNGSESGQLTLAGDDR